jgi:hypothetical protein
MNVWLLVIAVVAGIGVVLVGAMFFSTDTRLGLVGLAVLMTAETIGMVYAVTEA